MIGQRRLVDQSDLYPQRRASSGDTSADVRATKTAQRCRGLPIRQSADLPIVATTPSALYAPFTLGTRTSSPSAADRAASTAACAAASKAIGATIPGSTTSSVRGRTGSSSGFSHMHAP